MSDVSAHLKEFQREAVRRICARLNDKTGSQRFLLADEVGLGKTLVTNGVLEEFSRRRRGAHGLVCVYLCSNLEIAEQNRHKLMPDEKAIDVDRLTGLFARINEVEKKRRAGTAQMFLFTPGTSLDLGNALGRKEERLFLYWCLLSWRRSRVVLRASDWVDFFRAPAKNEDAWHAACADLKKRVRVPRRAQRRIRSAWNATSVLVREETGLK